MGDKERFLSFLEQIQPTFSLLILPSGDPSILFSCCQSKQMHQHFVFDQRVVPTLMSVQL